MFTSFANAQICGVWHHNDDMTIWVDSDACPVRIRDLVARAAHRRQLETIFIANKPIPLMPSPFVSFVEVPPDPDAADGYIEQHAEAGDIAITQDIPLAAALVPKKIVVISPRGMSFSEDNVAELLSLRDLLTELRDSGQAQTRVPPLDETAIRKFANLFDAAVHQYQKRKQD